VEEGLERIGCGIATSSSLSCETKAERGAAWECRLLAFLSGLDVGLEWFLGFPLCGSCLLADLLLS
jgi:hypothetical protein